MKGKSADKHLLHLWTDRVGESCDTSTSLARELSKTTSADAVSITLFDESVQKKHQSVRCVSLHKNKKSALTNCSNTTGTLLLSFELRWSRCQRFSHCEIRMAVRVLYRQAQLGFSAIPCNSHCVRVLERLGVMIGHTTYYALKKAVTVAEGIDMGAQAQTGLLLGSAAFARVRFGKLPWTC